MEIQFGLFEHLLKVGPKTDRTRTLILFCGRFKSPSKDFLHQILVDSFNQRDQANINEAISKTYSEPLEIDQKTAEQVHKTSYLDPDLMK